MPRPIHHRPTSFAFLHRLTEAHDRQTNEVKAAASLLGADHRLVRTLDLLAVLRRQLALSSLALGAGAIALAVGVPRATVVTAAAAIVELVLVISLGALRTLRCDLVRQLVIDGGGNIPLPVLAHELQRLTNPRTQASLAHALEHFVRTADAWPQIQRNARPVFDVRLVRASAPQLSEIAAQLRTQPAPPHPIALIEQLLTAGKSPLYGQDPAELHTELDHISSELAHHNHVS